MSASVSRSRPAEDRTRSIVPNDDALTWHGITLYGVIDIGLQFDTHSAPFTPYRPAASGNIVRQNDSQSAVGLTPSNMGQSRVGLQGIEALNEEWWAVFQLETFFNPQSGEIADSLKSLTVNNGRALAQQSIGVDGSSAGQAFQTAYAGLSSARFGSLTFGRQVTLLSEGTIKYDPNYNATAFGLLGASKHLFRRRQHETQPARTRRRSTFYDSTMWLTLPPCTTSRDPMERATHGRPGRHRRRGTRACRSTRRLFEGQQAP